MALNHYSFGIFLQLGEIGKPFVYLNKTLLFLGDQLSSSVMNVVFVSATSQISSANVTSRRPPTLQRGFLLVVSTLCMKNYQRQGHTPPSGAVLSCLSRRLQPIVTLFYRHCYGCWLTATLNWTTIYRSFLEVYPPLPLPHFDNCTNFPASNYSNFIIVQPLVSTIWSLSKKRLRILLSM